MTYLVIRKALFERLLITFILIATVFGFGPGLFVIIIPLAGLETVVVFKFLKGLDSGSEAG